MSRFSNIAVYSHFLVQMAHIFTIYTIFIVIKSKVSYPNQIKSLKKIIQKTSKMQAYINILFVKIIFYECYWSVNRVHSISILHMWMSCILNCILKMGCTLMWFSGRNGDLNTVFIKFVNELIKTNIVMNFFISNYSNNYKILVSLLDFSNIFLLNWNF